MKSQMSCIEEEGVNGDIDRVSCASDTETRSVLCEIGE